MGGVPTSSPAGVGDPLRDPSGEGLPAVHERGFPVGLLALPVLEGETVDQAATRRSVTLFAWQRQNTFGSTQKRKGIGGR